MATAAVLLAGGAVLALLAGLRGERITETPSVAAWLALGYLIVFGSIGAYTAYVYLLRTVRPALATSYAYANTAVAVALGVTLGAEILTGPGFIALPLILPGVGLAAIAPKRVGRDQDRLILAGSRRVGDEAREVSMERLPTVASHEPEESATTRREHPPTTLLPHSVGPIHRACNTVCLFICRVPAYVSTGPPTGNSSDSPRRSVPRLAKPWRSRCDGFARTRSVPSSTLH